MPMVDTYHDTYEEAVREACRRRKQASLAGQMTKVFPASFGRFVVRSMPAEFLMDIVMDGLPTDVFGPFGMRGATFDE